MALLFWSGLTNVTDLRGATRGQIPAGVVGTELSARGIEAAINHLRAGLPLFVDSGAFGAFMALQRRGKGSGECDWNRYFRIVSHLLPFAGHGKLALVAPDCVGDQGRTLALLREHSAVIAQWAVAGATVLVPHQLGGLSLTCFSDAVRSALPGVPYVVALPCKAKAMTTTQVEMFVRDARPRAIHLLGAGRAGAWRSAIARIESDHPRTAVTHDANCLRAIVGTGRPLTSRVKARVPELVADGVRGFGDLAWCDETEIACSVLNDRGALSCLPPAAVDTLASLTRLSVSTLRGLDEAEISGSADSEYGSALGNRLAELFHEAALWDILRTVAESAALDLAPRTARAGEFAAAYAGSNGISRYTADDAQIDLFAV